MNSQSTPISSELLNDRQTETDSQLLSRFVDGNDNEAFAELVRRYSDLVLGLCRRTLGDEHGAEDVFQATFLVLARRAAFVRSRASLAGWLYTVAYRTAQRARMKRNSRREQMLVEDVTDIVDDPLAQLTARHEQQLLDEEIRRLDDNYREPLVLRYLVGKSNSEIADQLGLTVGVVEGRLKRAKDCLRQQLCRRGISTTLALVAAATTAGTANANQSLIAATVEAAGTISGGLRLPDDCSELTQDLLRQELVMKTSTLATSASLTTVALILVALALTWGALPVQPIPQAEASTLIVSPAVSIEENQRPSYTLATTSQAKPKTDTRESATASTSKDQHVLNVDDPKELRGVAEGKKVRCQLRLGSPSREEGPVKYVLTYDSHEPRITVILEGEAAERLSKLGFDNRLVWGALGNRDAKFTGTLRKSPILNGEGAIVDTSYTIYVESITDFEVLPLTAKQIELLWHGR